MPRAMPNDTGYFLPREEPYRCGDVNATVAFVPHSDTEPERIREIHRDDVYHASLVLDTVDVATISEWVYLHPWNVTRALVDLGLIEPVVVPKKLGPQPKKLSTKDMLVTAMKGGRWVSLHRLIEMTGAKKETIVSALNEHRRIFEKRVRISTMNQKQRYYRLKPE
jgi:hypothetical protein